MPGVLIECEPAIKSIIMHLDSLTKDIIIEDIDDCRLVVKENMVDIVKQKLEEVCTCHFRLLFVILRMLTWQNQASQRDV